MRRGTVIRVLLGTAGILAASTCFALDDYKCTVTGAFQVNADGQQATQVLKSYVGSEFTVERRSGVMAGSLKNSYVTAPVVIDHGSKDNAFKVVTTMKNDITSNAYMLTVEEFVEGGSKPFVFVKNADIYYGRCVHF